MAVNVSRVEKVQPMIEASGNHFGGKPLVHPADAPLAVPERHAAKTELGNLKA
jgi:hypothetical protein